eukprot:gene5438-7154_t
MIRELREEVARLQKMVHGAGIADIDKEKAAEDIRESEKIMQELNETWEEKKSKSEVIKQEREHALREMGIALKDDGDAVGVFSPQKGPHLLNLSDDPLMSELLLYYISSGMTRAGRPDAEEKQHIQLSGEGIESTHCIFENENGVVYITPCSSTADCFVNGVRVTSKSRIETGSRVILGQYHVFRFVNPQEAKARREAGLSHRATSNISSPGPAAFVSPNTSFQALSEWEAAQAELRAKQTSVDLPSPVDGGDQKNNDKIIELEARLEQERQEATQRLTRQREEFEQKLARLAAEEASGSALAQESASTLESNVGENINNVDKMIASEARSNPSSTPRFMNRSRVQPLTPIERKVARNAFNKWRKYEARSLADELVGAASLLKEANIYSVDLNKAAEFQFALRRLTEFTPGSSRRTQLMIEASYVLNACCCDIEATITDRQTKEKLDMWSFPRFRDALFHMQDYYHSAIGQAPPTAIGVTQLRRLDPFPSKVPWFLTIGRGFVTLRNLLFNIPVEHDVTLVDENGYLVGQLRVMIQPGQLIKDLDNLDKDIGFQETQLDVSWYDFLEIQDELDEQEEGMLCSALVPVLAACASSNANSCKKHAPSSATISFSDDLISLEEESRINDDKDMGPEEDDDSEIDGKSLSRLGEKFRFVVTILNLKRVDKKFSDVFVHFGFQFGHQDAGASFSTEPQENSTGALNYYHAQQLCTEISEGFIDFIKRGKLRFEALGHTREHSLHNDSLLQDASGNQTNDADNSLFEDTFDGDLTSLPHSGGEICDDFSSSNQSDFPCADVLVNVEICELDPEGTYNPVPVKREGSLHDDGVFCLAQGLHRRVRITIDLRNTGALAWEAVCDTSIGGVREEKNISSTDLSGFVKLNIITTKRAVHGESMFIEAGWDSSRHESLLLDRVTSSRKSVYVTISVVLQLDGYDHPATFRSDICLRVHKERQTEGMLSRFMRGNVSEYHKQVDAFQLTMIPVERNQHDTLADRSTRKYVRGEENLGKWRPRSSSLFREHQDCLDRQFRIAEYECLRQDLVILEELGKFSSQVSSNTKNRSSSQTALYRKTLDLWQAGSLEDRLARHAPNVAPSSE